MRSSSYGPLSSMDVKYQIWKLGVVFTDNSFLYLAWYMSMSILGHYNNFFFAAHLLDIAMGFKTLRTILSSVTHIGKQLVLTVGLLAVVVYLYTVVAFNFFRRFFNKSEDGESPDMKCDDMLTTKCFICGIGNDYFDTVPHGFETHTLQEHNLANYLFFFMYLINKDETEHTGQESYVWKMYQERCWEFFPAGDCFQKQYEDQLN